MHVYNVSDVHLWTCDEGDLEDLSNRKAREIVERCFYEAQRETFMRVKQCLGAPTDDAAIHRSVTGAVRIAIEQSGGDYDSPDKESLEGAIEVLGKRAASWGTPDDILEHHKAQIRRVLSLLP
jgi:hypothetical protein